MIIGVLVFTIGMIPFVLALYISRINKGSNLSFGLFLFMTLITIWQADIGILYFKDQLSQETILFLFRLFRLAPIFSIPVVFYIAYTILENYIKKSQGKRVLDKFIHFIFTKKMFILLIIWSSVIYTINWTKLGVNGLELKKISNTPIEFYFPVYGPLAWLYIFHMSSLILFLLLIYLLSRKILNTNISKFLRAFTMNSVLLFAIGFINFSPGTGSIASSIGVIIFSIVIMVEFIKMNTHMKLNYYQLLERQKKLDYTGFLAGSLIHEVKNTNQVIKGFSQLLKNSVSLNEYEKGYVDMILQSTEQMENLSNNYREYMKHSKIEFKVENLYEIIDRSIDFKMEIIKEKNVEIEFLNEKRPLFVFVNKTYLQQVFINLIKNSLEAIPNDRENRKIMINVELLDDQIAINFHDTGMGIPPENWEAIFDPLITFKDSGMGLGLPFVKKMIFEHRGDIFVVDSTNAGTHLRITLPQLEMNERNYF